MLRGGMHVRGSAPTRSGSLTALRRFRGLVGINVGPVTARADFRPC